MLLRYLLTPLRMRLIVKLRRCLIMSLSRYTISRHPSHRINIMYDFKQSCLIRKNTKAIRDELAKFGYKMAPSPYLEKRRRGILCRPNVAIGIPKDSWEFNLSDYLNRCQNIIDCGENVAMFLALAALKEGRNDYQWFVVDKTLTDGTQIGEWVLFEDIGEEYITDGIVNTNYFHKAVPCEIVKHFNAIVK